MKNKNSLARLGFYIGAGIGLLLFVVVWLLPTSYFAGLFGLEAERFVFGNSLGILTGIAIAAGALISGALITGGAAITGWVTGTLADVLKNSIAARVSLATKTDGSSDLLVNSAKGPEAL